MPDTLFVTGAGGFVGARLLRLLASRGAAEMRCLSRTAPPPSAGADARVRWVAGDLRDPASYARHLEGVATVVHLAAATGARGRDEYYRVNVDGTARLLEASARAGVRRVLYVSSVAAKYDDPRYHYGLSKREAERVVERGGLAYAVVRPTIVAGRGAGAWRRLETLATAPVSLVVGDGTTRVQPVYVDDVARALARVLEDGMFGGGTYDLGGPEALPIADLLRRIRRARTGRAGPMLRLPHGPLAFLLGAVERILAGRSPVNAGQLSAFVHDGTADDNDLMRQLRPEMRTIGEMIELVARDG